jgi:hypothetical protein
MKKAKTIQTLALVLVILAPVVNVNAYTNLIKYQENVALAKSFLVNTQYNSEVGLCRESPKMIKAKSFLVNTQYNSEVGLCRESPKMIKNIYGLQSDNYLAYKALEKGFPSISKTIEDRMTELGYTGNCKYEALISDSVFSLPFVIQDFRAIRNHTLGYDDFNRADLGANWTSTGGDWAIVDNWLNGSGGKEILYYNVVQASDADITVKMKMTSGSYFGVVLRYENNTNFVVAWLNTVDGGNAVLQKVVNGVYDTVDSYPFAISLGQVYEVRFELLGGQHRLWINDIDPRDSPVLEGDSDISQNSGYAGVMVDSGVVAVYDDFEFVDYRIYNAFDTEVTQDDYEEYTDLAFVASAIRHNQHNIPEARRLFEVGLSYWDGYGFNDTKIEGEAYMAYQVALCLTVANNIHYNLGGQGATMEAILWGLQLESGGIPTHYLKSLEHWLTGEPNTETTSMAILAYAETPYSAFDISLILYIVVGIVFGIIIVNMIRKR